ncbi:MAG: PAS domain S-box protein [Chloroflexi bacterium]|nr:PAS domain S-box protein [Chloroflexota bacterium]
MGYKRDEVVGRNFARLGVLGLRDLPNMVRLFRDTIRAGEAVRMVELEIKHKNGSKVFVEVGTRFIRKNSKVGGVVNVFRDITERKRAEREIEERRMYLEGVLGAAPDAIVTLDAHHRIVEWNPGAEKLFGYSREEVIGQNIDDLVTRPDVFEEAVGFTQTVMGRGEVLPTETVRYRKDGSPVDVIVAGSPILVGDELTGVVAVYTDITERKRAEKQLRRYAAELERANEEVKQFAYIVSHDLRSPLVNLKGFTTELRFGLEVIAPAMGTALPYLDEKQRQGVTLALEEDIPEALGFIESSVTHMDRFISALLKLSRLGRRGLHLEPVDMEALVQATLQTLAHQIEQRQVEVTVGPLPEVVADRTSMEQVMANLLDNAVKYLDPDRRGQIEITAERSHDETTFRIRDNGRGIAKEDMDKVFAPFRRVGKQDVPGEGMGLPYVQALVRRHGGRIWCESGLGVGTTLSFTISNSNHIAEGGHRG